MQKLAYRTTVNGVPVYMLEENTLYRIYTFDDTFTTKGVNSKIHAEIESVFDKAHCLEIEAAEILSTKTTADGFRVSVKCDYKAYDLVPEETLLLERLEAEAERELEEEEQEESLDCFLVNNGGSDNVIDRTIADIYKEYQAFCKDRLSIPPLSAKRLKARIFEKYGLKNDKVRSVNGIKAKFFYDFFHEPTQEETE